MRLWLWSSFLSLSLLCDVGTGAEAQAPPSTASGGIPGAGAGAAGAPPHVNWQNFQKLRDDPEFVEMQSKILTSGFDTKKFEKLQSDGTFDKLSEKMKAFGIIDEEQNTTASVNATMAPPNITSFQEMFKSINPNSINAKEMYQSMMGQKICQLELCEGDDVALTKHKWNFTSGGCGPTSLMKMKSKFPFDSCCDLHAACYQVCGIDRQVCERTFKACLKKVCQQSGSRRACESETTIITMGSNMMGCDRFKDEQAESCECIAHKEAQGHLRTFIREFFERMPASIASEDEDTTPFPQTDEEIDAMIVEKGGVMKASSIIYKLINRHRDLVVGKKEDPPPQEGTQQPQWSQLREMAKEHLKSMGSEQEMDVNAILSDEGHIDLTALVGGMRKKMKEQKKNQQPPRNEL
uniref:Phospholipase A2 domain-containing protein n=1 Tax=Chromera velia CCMP2878 TaxID=1169474 RepID=A0A0G4I0Z0_9ALVE|eukprot:Cvel_10068.t1-p1 / transcript=Cvel_10068.t1 / gene=Cvel_10068 / organism=Chromera_velia_CCMP2878 / gene_product=Group XIIA secretory phospholipase A2, putative / transcript_product=Group XIIA secretory phospholipase A2, putative / location=Cvel_scaffold599:28605-30023(+) / protein_length=407 / sequence_SO=supercontig / SO=protein_coding / is_pseudo=false